jgi:hypothetical protein
MVPTCMKQAAEETYEPPADAAPLAYIILINTPIDLPRRLRR